MGTTRDARVRPAAGTTAVATPPGGSPVVGVAPTTTWRRPARAARWLWVATAVLLVVGVVVRLVANRLSGDASLPQTWIALGAHLVDVDDEENVPTFFSSGLLAALAVAFVAVAVLLRARGQQWWTFALPAAVAGLMSLDEFASLHNDLALVADELDLGKGVGFGWAVPGAVLAAVVGAVLLFVVARSWTSSLRLRLVAAGAVYLTGAVVMEFVSAPFYTAPVGGGDDSVQSSTYVLMNAVEEGLEMAGAVIAVWAVLSLLRAATGPDGVRLDLDPAQPALSTRSR